MSKSSVPYPEMRKYTFCGAPIAQMNQTDNMYFSNELETDHENQINQTEHLRLDTLTGFQGDVISIEPEYEGSKGSVQGKQSCMNKTTNCYNKVMDVLRKLVRCKRRVDKLKAQVDELNEIL